MLRRRSGTFRARSGRWGSCLEGRISWVYRLQREEISRGWRTGVELDRELSIRLFDFDLGGGGRDL